MLSELQIWRWRKNEKEQKLNSIKLVFKLVYYQTACRYKAINSEYRPCTQGCGVQIEATNRLSFLVVGLISRNVSKRIRLFVPSPLISVPSANWGDLNLGKAWRETATPSFFYWPLKGKECWERSPIPSPGWRHLFRGRGRKQPLLFFSQSPAAKQKEQRGKLPSPGSPWPGEQSGSIAQCSPPILENLEDLSLGGDMILASMGCHECNQKMLWRKW